MSLENFFWVKMSLALFIILETDGNIAMEAIKVRIIDMWITWVSNKLFSIH